MVIEVASYISAALYILYSKYSLVMIANDVDLELASGVSNMHIKCTSTLVNYKTDAVV